MGTQEGSLSPEAPKNASWHSELLQPSPSASALPALPQPRQAYKLLVLIFTGGLLPSHHCLFPLGLALITPSSSPPFGAGFTVQISEFTKGLVVLQVGSQPSLRVSSVHTVIYLHTLLRHS